MFLIFGVKRLKRRLGTTFALCGRCGTPAAQVVDADRYLVLLVLCPGDPSRNQILVDMHLLWSVDEARKASSPADGRRPPGGGGTAGAARLAAGQFCPAAGAAADTGRELKRPARLISMPARGRRRSGGPGGKPPTGRLNGSISGPKPSSRKQTLGTVDGKGEGNGRSTLLGADEESATTYTCSESDHDRHQVGPLRPVFIPSGRQAAPGQILRDRSRTPSHHAAISSVP